MLTFISIRRKINGSKKRSLLNLLVDVTSTRKYVIVWDLIMGTAIV